MKLKGASEDATQHVKQTRTLDLDEQSLKKLLRYY